MPMTTTYVNFCGRLISETRSGAYTEYISDDLGSCVATASPLSGRLQSRTDYWPYGEEIPISGTNPSPWGYVGLLGYYKDLSARPLYVRARFLDTLKGQWITRDRMWPGESAVGYVHGAPTVTNDPSGLKPPYPVPQGCLDVNHQIDYKSIAMRRIKLFCGVLSWTTFGSCVKACLLKNFFTYNNDDVETHLNCMRNWCKDGEIGCADCSKFPKDTVMWTTPQMGSKCKVRICKRAFDSNYSDASWTGILAHELGHCCSTIPTFDGTGPWSVPGAYCNYGAGICIDNCLAESLRGLFQTVMR